MAFLRFFLSFFLPARYSTKILSLHPIPPERRDIAWLFKRDNLNLSLARLLRQTRKDLFYDVNKILGDCALSRSHEGVENTYRSRYYYYRNFLLKIIYLSIYTHFSQDFKRDRLWGNEKLRKRKVTVILLHFSFFRLFSLLFLSFLSIYNAPLLLNYPANESNAWYIPSETMWLVKNSLLSLQSHRVI